VGVARAQQPAPDVRELRQARDELHQPEPTWPLT
jgi:hypothetical protein